MKSVLILALLVCLAIPGQAAFYEITGGYTPGLTLENFDSLFMTGGGLGILTLFDSSSATIQGTSALQQFFGGIWTIQLGYNSSLYMFGGQVHEIAVSNDATATLTGGLIESIWSTQSTWKYDDSDPPQQVPNPHITVVYLGDLPTVQEIGGLDYLVGNWGGGDPFSIYLHDVDGYSPVIDNIQFELIPEPATLALLGLGAFLMLTRRLRIM